MTTIAVSKFQIASDKQVTHTNGFKFKVNTKLFEFDNKLVYPEPFILGYAGNVDKALRVIGWMYDPENQKKPKPKGCEFVVLTKNKKIFTFVDPAVWIEVKSPEYAIGSGSTFALAAMKAGKTPKEAVKIASEFDPMSGGGVHFLTHK